MPLQYKKRDPSLPKGRQVDDEALQEVGRLIGAMPRRRDMLIEALHKIQDNTGALHAQHLAALAELFGLSQAQIFEVASFYHHFDIVKEGEKAPPPLTIRICKSLSCKLAGADELARELQNSVDPAHIRISRVSCIGRCAAAPAANIGKRALEHATTEKLLHAARGDLTPEIPDYRGLDDYIAEGGYEVLRACLSGKKKPEDVIALISNAGLRGLGGAGFPAGKKWNIVRGFDAPRLMSVNCDEGEPGTFKDRFWLESSPHRVLEGALIAAWAVGCERIYFYVRDEYPAVLQILAREIAALAGTGLLKHAPIELRRGAGAYICGEESAMLESMEGKRPLPRQRPPYIAQNGLFGRPTLNHNVETLSWVAEIIRDGAEAFSAKGCSGHSGPRSFSVSGRVKSPGIKIAPAGISPRQLIDDYCGGMAEGHSLKAFLPGGASGGIFPASMADLPLDFGSFEQYGGFIGSHALIILSDRDNIRDAVFNLLEFFAHESCGQCTPCRLGTRKLPALLQNNTPDEKLIKELAQLMRDTSICGLGQAAPNPALHLLRYFPAELKGGVK